MLLKKNKIENEVENIIPLDQYSDIFEKLPTKQKLSFELLKEQIQNKDAGLSGMFTMILLLILSSFGSSALYVYIISQLGLFKIHALLSTILFFSPFLVFYSSAFFFGKFMNSKKIFKYQRTDTESKKFYEYFLNCDTDSLVSELKNTLLTQLENTQIHQYNPAVYNYINRGIDNITGDFSKLKYEIEQNLQREQYTFEPFKEFLREIENVSDNIKGAKDIKVINQ